jgi:hypothetical protein
MPQRRLVVLQSEIDVEPLGAVVLSRLSEGQRTTLDAQGSLSPLSGPASVSLSHRCVVSFVWRPASGSLVHRCCLASMEVSHVTAPSNQKARVMPAGTQVQPCAS